MIEAHVHLGRNASALLEEHTWRNERGRHRAQGRKGRSWHAAHEDATAHDASAHPATHDASAHPAAHDRSAHASGKHATARGGPRRVSRRLPVGARARPSSTCGFSALGRRGRRNPKRIGRSSSPHHGPGTNPRQARSPSRNRCAGRIRPRSSCRTPRTSRDSTWSVSFFFHDRRCGAAGWMGRGHDR